MFLDMKYLYVMYAYNFQGALCLTSVIEVRFFFILPPFINYVYATGANVQPW